VTTDPGEAWAKRHGFDPKVEVPKIGRLHRLATRASRRSGVYLPYFENGDHYVGRAKDVISRLGEHPPRSSATFRLCSTIPPSSAPLAC